MNTNKKKAHLVRGIKAAMYLLGKVLAVLLIIELALFAFETAENSAQIYMLSRDAFTKRTSVIMNPINNPDTELLDGIFTQEYLDKTQLRTQQKNSSYIISGYDQQTKVPITVVFAWKDTMDIRVENIVQDIAWKFDTSVLDKSEVDQFIESGTFILHMVKEENGRWKVNDITLEEEYYSETAYPTPWADELEEGEAGSKPAQN